MLINKIKFRDDVMNYINSTPEKKKILVPYYIWQSNLEEDDFKEFNMVKDTEEFNKNSGFYLSSNNFMHEFFTQVTNWNFVSKRYYAHGTCDNASQVLEKYNKMLLHPKRKFIVTLEPVFQCDQKGLSGFKWYRTGEYIGQYEKKSEYLEDEPEIKFIFKFLIYEVTEKRA